MPLAIHPCTPSDALSFIRIRSTAYYGPTHDILHNGAIRESSIQAVALDRARDISKPNTWHWKIVDTDLDPVSDDPEGNGGRTIAVACWTLCNFNVKEDEEGGGEDGKVPDIPNYTPPELRLDALASLFTPLRQAQKDIMGSSSPYFMLNTLATHREHQRRGAGKMLLNWGLRKADEEGLTTYLDATGVARGMYERAGFVVKKSVEWDRTPWGGEGVDVHYCLVREPRKKT
jgi:GNAT superfamily N-acetyltransferase